MRRYVCVVGNWLNTSLSRRQLLKFCLIAGMLLGMLAHGFMFANKIPNHDDLAQYADRTAHGRGARTLCAASSSGNSLPI